MYTDHNGELLAPSKSSYTLGSVRKMGKKREKKPRHEVDWGGSTSRTTDLAAMYLNRTPQHGQITPPTEPGESPDPLMNQVR